MRYILFLYCIVCISLITVTGCNELGPQFSGLPESKPDKALILVYRPFSNIEPLMPNEVLIDKNKIGCLENQSYTTYEIDPGRYTIFIGLGGKNGLCGIMNDKMRGTPNKSFEAEGGKIYFFRYIRYNSENPFTDFYHKLEPVSNEIGLSEVKSLRVCICK